jgi:hypothetical protein
MKKASLNEVGSPLVSTVGKFTLKTKILFPFLYFVILIFAVAFQLFGTKLFVLTLLAVFVADFLHYCFSKTRTTFFEKI